MSTFSKIYAVHHANKRSRLSDVMLFTLGLISFFRIELIGQIYLVEIVASVLLLIVLWVRRFELTIPITHRILLILGFFWLCGAILTDIYRSTPWEDLARGWASIIFLLLLIVFLYQLILVDTVKVYIIILGYGIGQAFGIILQPSELAEIDPWKFGLGSAITVLLVAWIGLYYWRYNQISRLGLASLFGLGFTSLALGSRSLGAVTIILALFIWIRTTDFGTRIAHMHLTPLRLIFFFLICICVVSLIGKTYGYSASKGLLGESAHEKYEIQSSGIFGIFVGGRIELLSSSRAIIDSPLLGHGSWAKGSIYRDYFLDMQEAGYQYDAQTLQHYIDQSDLIPTHSHVTQAWVWAGLLGVPFWLYVLFLCFKCGIKSIQNLDELSVPALFFAILGIWNVLFSPYGSFMRFLWAISLIVIIRSIDLKYYDRE